MYKFPFPLVVGDALEEFSIGYVDDKGQFQSGSNYDGTPSSGLTANDSHYLIKLNCTLNDVVRSAESHINVDVFKRLDPFYNGAANVSTFFNERKNHMELRRLTAQFIVHQLKYQEDLGEKQVAQLADLYKVYVTLPDDAYEHLAQPYSALAPDELRMLTERLLDKMASARPDYRTAFNKLGWNREFLDQLERNDGLVRFYAALRHAKAKK